MTDSSARISRSQRSPKNYLLDRRFQLRYAGYLTGMALLLSIGLGLLIWSSSVKVMEQSAWAVQQAGETARLGRETLERGKQVVTQRQRAGDVLQIYMGEQYRDELDVSNAYLNADAAAEKALEAEQQRMERDSAVLVARATEIELQAREAVNAEANLLYTLIGALSFMVLAVGTAGIVVTHKVAGPIHKMTRLLSGIGSGKLAFKERLRKGDELQGFFDALTKMTDDLRARKMAEIERLDAAIEKVAKSQGGASSPELDGAVEALAQLRAEMRAQIET